MAEIARIAGVPVDVLSEHEEGRLAFIGATKTFGHPVEGEVGVVDVGGGSSEVVLGSVAKGCGPCARSRSARGSSPTTTWRTIRRRRPSCGPCGSTSRSSSTGWSFERPAQAVAVGGSATSLRTLVGAVLEYETLERAVRVLTSDPIADVAKRFELDPRRVRLLPAGVLLLEKLSELLGQPLQIGKGGLREGVILDLLNGAENGTPKALAA